MATVDVGTTAKVKWTHDTSVAATLTVTAPDGSTTTPPVTQGEAAFEADVATTLPGRHLLRWAIAAPAETWADVLDVWPADPRFLLGFDDAVAAVRWRAADVAKYGDDLRLHMATVTEVLEDIVGAVLVRTVVQTADGGKTGVALWERPDEIVSVTVGGAAYPDYRVNASAAIVYAGEDPAARFADGRQNVVVTYRAGTRQVPPSILEAARILIRHMVDVEQAPSPVASAVGDDVAPTPSGFLVPRRVLELCANRHTLPGIA